jgi:hypothetical protein
MSYVNSVLQPGENLQARSTLHWLVYGRTLIALVAAIAFFIASRQVVQYGVIFQWIAAIFGKRGKSPGNQGG